MEEPNTSNVDPRSETGTQLEEYTSWRQVAGYFDGDGNVGMEVVKYILKFKLRFSDTWRPQVEAVKSFMNQNEIHTSEIWHEKEAGHLDAYRIEVSAVAGVRAAAKAILPFCVKKAEDLRTLVDYLEDRITGDQAIDRYNQEVRLGRRSGYIRKASLPYLRTEGRRKAQLENAQKARAAYAVNVSADVQDSVRRDHAELGLSHVRLSRKYGYSASVIRRILGTK